LKKNISNYLKKNLYYFFNFFFDDYRAITSKFPKISRNVTVLYIFYVNFKTGLV